VARVEPFAAAAGLGEHAGTPLFAAAVALQQVRARTLVELAEQLRPYFASELVYDEAASRKYQQTPDLDGLLAELGARWAALLSSSEASSSTEASWSKEALEESLRALATARAVKAAALIHPVRMALAGNTAGPPLFDLVEVLGRGEVAQRLARYRQYLGALPAA
jgi:glutamyl/glutaminyl-tRNA synthetase